MEIFWIYWVKLKLMPPILSYLFKLCFQKTENCTCGSRCILPQCCSWMVYQEQFSLTQPWSLTRSAHFLGFS